MTPAGDLTLETEAASVQKPGAPAGALGQDVDIMTEDTREEGAGIARSTGLRPTS